jgi:hypothetical protein
MVHAATHGCAARSVACSHARVQTSADVRCWRTDRRRSTVFGLRRYVCGVPNGEPGRWPNGGRGEADARPDNCDRRGMAARSRARTGSRMVSGVAVSSRRGRRAVVVRGRIGRSRLRTAGRRRPNRVGNTIVHRARMQCRWLLLDYEGPGRKDRGDRATTRSPHHCKNYDWLLVLATPARCVRRPLEIIEPGRSASPISTRSSRCRR